MGVIAKADLVSHDGTVYKKSGDTVKIYNENTYYEIQYKIISRLQIQLYVYSKLFEQIKHVLYYRDKEKKSKMNFSLYLQVILRKAKMQIENFYDFYYPFINNVNAYHVACFLSTMFYKSA